MKLRKPGDPIFYGKYKVSISEHEDDFMFQVLYEKKICGKVCKNLCAWLGWRKKEEYAILEACQWIDKNG